MWFPCTSTLRFEWVISKLPDSSRHTPTPYCRGEFDFPNKLFPGLQYVAAIFPMTMLARALRSCQAAGLLGITGKELFACNSLPALAGEGGYSSMDIPHNTTWEIKKATRAE